MSNLDDLKKKAMDAKVSITRKLDDWRQMGELLSNYKELLAVLHSDVLKSEDGDDSGKARIAEQAVYAMKHEKMLMRDIVKAAQEEIGEELKGFADEYKKAN